MATAEKSFGERIRFIDQDCPLITHSSRPNTAVVAAKTDAAEMCGIDQPRLRRRSHRQHDDSDTAARYKTENRDRDPQMLIGRPATGSRPNSVPVGTGNKHRIAWPETQHGTVWVWYAG
ncbi:MAG: hypothetical protein V4537_00235 [Pseudomonadota bacterium]